jgi:hypothetical protein
MGINELVLVGTGFVLARVVYLWYFTPSPRKVPRSPDDRRKN